jgi:hypothetical protein
MVVMRLFGTLPTCGHARTRLLPVDEHSARAALCFTTTVFRSREVEVVTLNSDVCGWTLTENLLSVDIKSGDFLHS